MKKERNHINGVLLVDKPSDWTSFDVVNCIRRHFNLDKTGHCGTLDPFATGLLVILLGRATKWQDRLMAQDKEYTGTMKLGVCTDSQDLTGQTVSVSPLPELAPPQWQRAADAFLGDSLQIPPMHSAVKLNGQPLYKLAHKGREIERPPRPVHISTFSLTAFRLPEIDFSVRCSKGTYIRTLAADFGMKIGCGAHLTALRRTASGRHSIRDAFTLETIRTWTTDDLQAHLHPEENEDI